MAILPALFIAAGLAHADSVKLNTGAAMKGIIIEQSDELLKLQVDEDGYAELPTKTIAVVYKDEAAANEKIRASWAAERRKAEAVEEKDRKFAADQRAKGLVLYEGEWMKPAEVELRLKRRDQDQAAHGKNAQVFMAHEAAATTPVPQSHNTVLLSYVPLAVPVENPRRHRKKAKKSNLTVLPDGTILYSN